MICNSSEWNLLLYKLPLYCMKTVLLHSEIMWMFSEAMISINKELSVLLLFFYLHVFVCDSAHDTTDTVLMVMQNMFKFWENVYFRIQKHVVGLWQYEKLKENGKQCKCWGGLFLKLLWKYNTSLQNMQILRISTSFKLTHFHRIAAKKTNKDDDNNKRKYMWMRKNNEKGFCLRVN